MLALMFTISVYIISQDYFVEKENLIRKINAKRTQVFRRVVQWRVTSKVGLRKRIRNEIPNYINKKNSENMFLLWPKFQRKNRTKPKLTKQLNKTYPFTLWSLTKQLCWNDLIRVGIIQMNVNSGREIKHNLNVVLLLSMTKRGLGKKLWRLRKST